MDLLCQMPNIFHWCLRILDIQDVTFTFYDRMSQHGEPYPLWNFFCYQTRVPISIVQRVWLWSPTGPNINIALAFVFMKSWFFQLITPHHFEVKKCMLKFHILEIGLVLQTFSGVWKSLNIVSHELYSLSIYENHCACYNYN